MKTTLLFALILTEMAAMGYECAPPEIARGRARVERLPVVGERVGVVETRRIIRDTRSDAPLQPVRERVTRTRAARPSTHVEGVALRVLTAPNPAQMINPLAPSEYGSARGLVTYTERDPYRTSNENKFGFQPSGIRFLTIRPLW